MTQRSAWVGLFVLATAVFAVITIEVVPIGLLPDLVDAFEITEAAAGMLVSIYAAIVAVTSIAITRYTRRLKRKPLMIATLAIFAASCLWATAASSFEVLLASRAVGGLAHALFFSLVIGYAARIAPVGMTGRAIALVATGTSIGIVLGLPAGTALGAWIGWRGTFLTLGVLVSVCAVLALVLLPAVSHDVAAGKRLAPGGWRLVFVAAGAGACFLGYYTLYTYVSPLLLAAGLPEVWLSGVLVLLGIAGFVGIRLVARRLDARPLVFLMIIPAALALTQVSVALSAAVLVPLLIAVTAWTASFGPVNSAYQNVLVRVGRDNPEMAGAWINMTCNIGIGGGGALGGVLITHTNYATTAFVGAAIVAIILALTIALRTWLRPPLDA